MASNLLLKDPYPVIAKKDIAARKPQYPYISKYIFLIHAQSFHAFRVWKAE